MPSFLKYIVPSSIVQQRLSGNDSILFTFDDGPHSEFTRKTLDALDKYEAKGLFFIPSIRISRDPSLLREIIERKHGIGNHSFSHASNRSLSFREIIKEINRCSDDIFSLTGKRTAIYRPPMGIVTLSLILAAKYCKHQIMRWSIDVGEYSDMKNASSLELADNFLKKEPGGAIVLSHDDTETTHAFLERVLPVLVDRGYDLKNGLASLHLYHDE